MYKVSTESTFDSAHFLSGYSGKCSNLHGHRWRVIVYVNSENLIEEGNDNGMVVDFANLKNDLNEICDKLDHTLIYQVKTLKSSTRLMMEEEGFALTPVEFRPTAENFAKYFYDHMKGLGYNVCEVTVYETPSNAATYSE